MKNKRSVMLRAVCISVSLTIVTSCSSATQHRQTNKNYRINAEESTSIGGAMISREDITIIEQKRWVGVFNSPDGWQTTRIPTDNSFREELIYTGRVGDTLRISYREYKRDFARPAFYQELTYDLSQSSEIVFRTYVIDVKGADNRQIRFVVKTD